MLSERKCEIAAYLARAARKTSTFSSWRNAIAREPTAAGPNVAGVIPFVPYGGGDKHGGGSGVAMACGEAA